MEETRAGRAPSGRDPIRILDEDLERLLASRPADDYPQIPEPPPHQGPWRVLLVDDNRDYRDVLRCLLRDHGFEVDEAVNGALALARVRDTPPDIVIVDFNMPKMNGYEFLVELRAATETRKIPVIMFSGAPNRERIKEIGLDVSAFLDKPVSNRALVEAVCNALDVFAAPGTAPRPRREREFPAGANPHLREDLRPRTALPSPEGLLPPVEPSRAASALRPAAPKTSEAALPRDSARSAAPKTSEAGRPLGPGGGIPSPDGSVTLPRDNTHPPAPLPPARTSPAPPAAPRALPLPSAQPADTAWIEEELEEDEPVEMVEEKAAGREAEQGLEVLANESPIIRRVNSILARAVELRASDIHIEPQEDRIVVRARLDGSLRPLCSVPSYMGPRLTARVKIMSNLSITEHRLPQDGQFRAHFSGQKVEFRVSTLPSTYGEKIVVRVLGQSKLRSDLGQLGFNLRDLEAAQKAIQSPHGLILVTGPTGSGKSTTLYTMISAVNRPDVNVLTAEDPVEYRLPGITQVHVKPAIGLTFEAVLRAFLRQDPDVMLVGEIRDRDTAEIALKASITGHLVLSTLHTNSAPAAVARLTQMGLPPYLVSASVKLVVAQRLVKLLCPACKVPAALAEDERRYLASAELDLLKQAFRGTGCDRCHQTGYCGRRPVFEVMPVATGALRKLIESSDSLDLLHDLAVSEGMVPLRRAALEIAARGETSLHEALKLILAE